MPVTLQLYGPRYAVKGDRVYFHAVSTGKTGRVAWSLDPPIAGAITPIEGNAAEFSSLMEGAFTITAVVAGEGNQPAISQLSFENVMVAAEEDLLPPEPEQHYVPPAQQMIELPPPPPTAQELTLGAVANVMSENKHAEALSVANAIFSVVRRLDSGLLAPNTDIPLEIEQQVKMGMGPKADPWLPFTVAIDTIIEEYRRQGKVTTAASQKPVLMEIANTLLSVR